MAIAGAVAIAALLAVYVAKLRRKETRFGCVKGVELLKAFSASRPHRLLPPHREAFEPMMESGELVVRYRARRTYSRRTTEATRESLRFSQTS